MAVDSFKRVADMIYLSECYLYPSAFLFDFYIVCYVFRFACMHAIPHNITPREGLKAIVTLFTILDCPLYHYLNF